MQKLFFARIRLKVVARIVLLLSSLLFLQCATYWNNRLADSADLVSVGIQTESYGASLRTGPVDFGIQYKSAEGKDLGLRQGYTGPFNSQSFVAFVLGSEILEGPRPAENERIRDQEQLKPPPGLPDKSDANDSTDRDNPGSNANPEVDPKALQQLEKLKQMSMEEIEALPAYQQLSPEQKEQFRKQLQKLKEQTTIPTNDPTAPAVHPRKPSEMELRKKTYKARSPLGTNVPFQKKNTLLKSDKEPISKGFAPLSYLTTIELKLGLFGGVYFAFHAGELVDLLAGFVGLDPMDDDAPLANPASNLTEEQRKQLEKLTPEQRKQLEEYQRQQQSNRP